MTRRSRIGSVIVVVLLFAGYVCIRELPGILGKGAARQVAKPVAEDAARDAARRVARDLGPGLAREIARGVADESRYAPVAATRLDRADYAMTLPDGATVDPPDAEVERNRMTSVDLPEGGSMIILAFPEKAAAGDLMPSFLDRYKAKLKDPVVALTAALDAIRTTRSAEVSGMLEGSRIVFDIGESEGTRKEFVVVLAYPQDSAARTLGSARKAHATFQILE